MKPTDFELEVLRALRHPAFRARWHKTFPPILSPLGQRVGQALMESGRLNGKANVPLTQADCVAVLRRDGNMPASLSTLVGKVFDAKGVDLDICGGLAEQVLQVASLDALMARATTMRASGKLDLDALATTLRQLASANGARRGFDAAAIAREGADMKVLATPWPSVNRILEGGVRPKELCMVLAVPKAGKSCALLNLAAGALEQGYEVLYLTAADIGYQDICVRLAGIWLDRPAMELRRDQAGLLKAQRGWEEKGGRLVVADYVSRPVTLSLIEHDIEATVAEAGKRPVAVLLDRLEQVTPAERTDNIRVSITANFEVARALSHRHAVPIICDSQAGIKDGDEGWVYIDRGSEARIGKAKTVDLSVGIGLHPENQDVLRLVVQGRREGLPARLELNRDPRSGLMYE